MTKKSLGQNFLIDPNYQRKIIDAVRRDYQGQPVLEIGPGKGALTGYLSDFAKNLILVEKDKKLADDLREKFGSKNNVRIIYDDFLDLAMPSLRVPSQSGQKIISVANLPYNVASQILIKIFTFNHLFDSLYLTLQKEVGNRCLAKIRTKEYGIFTIWTQVFSEVKKLFNIPPTAFHPRPKVTSTFLQFILKPVDYEKERPFIDFVKKIFNQRRKKISTILKKISLKENSPLPLWERRAPRPNMPNGMFDAVREEGRVRGQTLAQKRAEELSVPELKELFIIYSQNFV